MDYQLEFRVLGPLEIMAGGREVKVDAPKQRALLAVLLLHANEVVSTDRLMAAIWGDDEVGVSTLRYHISKLRDSLEGGESSRLDRAIITRPPGYVLEVEPDAHDAIRFDHLIDAARRLQASDPAESLTLLDKALDLWRGDPYAEFAYEEFAHLEVERLEEKRRGAIEDRFDVLLALGRHQEAVAELQALAPAHPLRERLWGQLALSLYRSGRQAGAVDTLQRLRSQLADVGLELSPPLRALEQQFFDQDPALLADVAGPDRLRGYVLLGQIGEGAHGVVWRASQPGIGREVALKAIRPELANQSEFVRRFEAEAQLVATLEHPNIVSLYDFWRDPEGAYLVMPYLRGGNLAGVLTQGPLDPPAVLDLVAAVGAALGHAHRRGVVHRDVTPHNVLLDEDGNPYLADFGMAALLGGEGPPATSSPAYMSPEASAGRKAVVQSDVFSLGVLVHASLSGRVPVVGEKLPLVSELRHDLSRAVDDVISCATSPEIVHRYSDVQDFVDALARAVGVSREDTPCLEVEERNPYKGLRAFEESDAADFFGREMLISELVQSVARRRLVAVVGPSGCGKSSLVKAGLIPVLRRGALPGSERWLITDMYPGSRPLAELGTALMRVAVERPDGFEETLANPDADLAPAFDQLLPRDRELLLVVDQFEELFTLTVSEAVRGQFLDLLTRICGEPALRARVVLTMRADFYDRPLEDPNFGELVRRGLVSVTMPAKEHLHEAITGPAARVGIGVDEGLAETIVNDVAGQPGALPLMEYALTELFEHRIDQRLRLHAYNESAGVMGALGRRAEEIFNRYDESGKDAVRQIFLRLVTVEAGSEDTRRRIPLAELRGLGIDPAALQQTLDDFGEHRLLTFDRDPDTREPTVEVAHEALLSRWERLQVWIDDRRGDLTSYRRLAASAKEWVDSDRADEYLLSGGRLAHCQAFAAETDLFLTSTDAEFLAASHTYDSELAGRRRRRRRATVAGFGIAAMIATVLALVAFANQRWAEDEAARAEGLRQEALVQKEAADESAAQAQREELRAEKEATQARASELAASAAQALDEDPVLSIRLLLESIDTAGERDAETVADLHEAVLANRMVMELQDPFELGVLSPNGDVVLAFGEDFYTVLSVPSGDPIWQQEQDPAAFISAGHFSTDGATHLVIPESGDEGQDSSRLASIHALDVATGDRTIHPIDTPYPLEQLIPNGSGTIDPELPIIAMAVIEGTDGDPTDLALLRVDLYDGSAEEVIRLDEGAVSQGQWTTDRAVTLVAFGHSLQTAVLDLSSREWQGFGDAVSYGSNAAFSPDGRYVATTDSKRADVWDLRQDRLLWTIPNGLAEPILFSADGDRLLTGSRLWDAHTGELLVELPAPPWDGSMSADGKDIMLYGQLFNTDANGELGFIDLPIGNSYWPGVDVVGDTGVVVEILDISAFGTAHIFSVASGEVLTSIEHVLGRGTLSSDGATIALQQEVRDNWSGDIGIFNTHTGDLVTTLSGFCESNNNSSGLSPGCNEYPEMPFRGFAYNTLQSPDASFAVAFIEVSDGRVLVAWDMSTGEIVYRSPRGFVEWFPELSPSGEQLFVPQGDRTAILDTQSWEIVGEIPEFATHLRFLPDGTVIADTWDGLVRYEPGSWEHIAEGDIVSSCGFNDLDLSSDGRLFATPCHTSGNIAGNIAVYDSQTLALETMIATGDPDITGVEFVNDKHLLAIKQKGPGIILTTDIDELLEIARGMAGDFSVEQCERYMIERCMPEPEKEPES